MAMAASDSGSSSSKHTKRYRFTVIVCVALVFFSVSLFSLENFRNVRVVEKALFRLSSSQALVVKQLNQSYLMVMDKGNDHTLSVSGSSSLSTANKTKAMGARHVQGVSGSNVTTNDCFALNSETWLEGPRLGNINDPLMDDSFIRMTIADLPFLLAAPGRARSLLKRTITYDTSRFVNDTESLDDPKSLRLWTVRLMYLSMWYHQHRLAIPEATARLAGNCLPETHQIGRFDYECPNAKYIIVSLTGNGLGINVRAVATTALLAGLVSNRVVLFVNNRYVKSENFQPWKLASCNRRDAQCFFMPVSPCVPLLKDVEKAFDLESKDLERLFQDGSLPEGHEEDKVWRHTVKVVPRIQIPPIARQMLRNYTMDLLANVPMNDARLPAIQKAANDMLRVDDARPRRNYALANIRISHALSFYFLRPNMEYTKKLEGMMKQVIPSKLDPETSFGLPIRASDKCHAESECLSFQQHIQAATLLWKQHQNYTGETLDPNIIFTTEAKDMRQQYIEFTANSTIQKAFPYNFTFVTNHKDLTPDTGFFGSGNEWKMNFTADDAMLSVMATFKLQLLPRVTVGNCCSNFHVLLNDFLSEGLGVASTNTFTCLEELDDPELRVCCGWWKGCKKERAKLVAQKKAL